MTSGVPWCATWSQRTRLDSRLSRKGEEGRKMEERTHCGRSGKGGGGGEERECGQAGLPTLPCPCQPPHRY